MNVYQSCPVFLTQRFTLRLVRPSDAPGLLRVYSDRQAQAYFNADNCTSDFRYSTLAEMEDCVNMWVTAYELGWFVRWVILERGKPVGTVEMFRRDEGDDGRGCGVLRIDLRSDREFEDVYEELLRVMFPALFEHFGVGAVLTKAPSFARQRQEALREHGFVPWDQPLVGHNGVAYGDYWIRRA